MDIKEYNIRRLIKKHKAVYIQSFGVTKYWDCGILNSWVHKRCRYKHTVIKEAIEIRLQVWVKAQLSGRCTNAYLVAKPEFIEKRIK